MNDTRGVLYIHSTPSALCPHIEWAVGGLLGMPVSLDWIAQPVERATYRAELSWTGPTGSAAQLASTLKGWQRIRYEVTEEPSAGAEGVRYAYTPRLGVFSGTIGQHGDLLISEERIKHAVVCDALGRKEIMTSLDELLGRPWDEELEPFRHAGADTPVRWLHQVG
ncbi:DUF3145 domain-containing protein [Naumannella halotolerans]|uniref:Uncharacterized protein DUF3145 n=1 Tax=Naumannella halotolerans TaxID=993414 RepID=A0A4R7J929_9ACTN|nr:DUF3145 domain-containing protein [Naumannella halotolerans]TDT33804.1 uncharacterized protein DUF3145 [Naumannella halotolerans]